jgi:hypothetical protein
MASTEKRNWILGFLSWLLLGGTFVWLAPMNLQAPAVTSLATIAVAAVSVRTIFWQISKQAKNADILNKENEKRKLKISIYTDVAKVSREAADARSDFFAATLSLRFNISLAIQMAADGFPPGSPSENPQSLINLFNIMRDKLRRLGGEIERWIVVDPRISVFQLALSANAERMQPIFDFYLQHAIRFIPSTMQGDTVSYKWRLPFGTEMKALESINNQLDDCGRDLVGVLFDLGVEMQNLLVGDLFGATVPAREPLDKSIEVIRLSDHARLSEKFRAELRRR